jgi:hypothetical protein
MTPEGKIKAAVKRVLATLDETWAHWPVSNGMGGPCLDAHGCYRGIYFAIETKAPGGVPTPRQEETIRRIASTGGLVMVISTVEGAQSIPRWLEEHRVHVARRHSY